MRNIPAESLTFPLQIMEYANEKLLTELSVANVVRLQDVGFIYQDLLAMATNEIRRLCDRADEDQS